MPTVRFYDVLRADLMQTESINKQPAFPKNNIKKEYNNNHNNYNNNL
jgi:hypothetical protein